MLHQNESNPQVSDPWKPNLRENREVRRKLRIARKLHELEEDVQNAASQVCYNYLTISVVFHNVQYTCMHLSRLPSFMS